MRFLHLLSFLFIAFVSSTNGNTSFHDNAFNDLTDDCEFTYVVDNDNFSVTITTIEAPHIKVKVLDASWDPISVCTDNCSNPVVVNNLPIGEYIITVMYFTDDWETTCITNETFEVTGGPCVDNDEDGLCAYEDCNDFDASLPQPEGTACNDYNGATINDQIQADGCTCLGTLYQGGCNLGYYPTADVGHIHITGLIAHAAKVRIYDPSDWSTVYSCDSDCANEEFALNVPAGYYNIDIILYDENFNEICTLNDYFNWDPSTCIDNDLDGICISADCDDNNATLPGTAGADCDDQNSATINDIVGQDGCSCAGEVYEGLCNISYLSGSNSLSVFGLIAAHVKVRVYDADWNKVFECFDDCDQELIVDGLTPNEAYYFKARLMDEEWNTICSMQEYFVVQAGNTCEDNDEDGYCDDIDCDSNDPTWPKAPGTPCDDGNDATFDDVIQSDGCSCAGEDETSSDPCSSVYIFESGGSIYIGGFPADYVATVKVFSNSNFIFGCSDNCEDPTIIAELPSGNYDVSVKILDNNWELVCSVEETISLLVDNPDGMITMGEAFESYQMELNKISSVTKEESTDDLSEVLVETNIHLYPNPVNEQLTISIEGYVGKTSVLEIYNQLGQVVLRKEVARWPTGNILLNCSTLNKGVYHLVIRTDDGQVISKQFVK